MAAIAPLIVPAGAPAPTVVMVTGTTPGNNLATTFLATDPSVINYPTLTFVFLAVNWPQAACSTLAPSSTSVILTQRSAH